MNYTKDVLYWAPDPKWAELLGLGGGLYKWAPCSLMVLEYMLKLTVFPEPTLPVSHLSSHQASVWERWAFSLILHLLPSI